MFLWHVFLCHLEDLNKRDREESVVDSRPLTFVRIKRITPIAYFIVHLGMRLVDGSLF